MSFNERIYFDSQLNFDQEGCYISKDGILRYLQTDRLIWNRNYTVPFKVKKFFSSMNNKSFVDEDGNISALNSPNMVDITDTSTWLLPLGKYFNGELGFMSGRGNECYKDPDTGEWGPNYWSRSIFTLKNGEQWVVQNFHNNSMVPLVDTEERPIKRLVKFGSLPNGELIYKVNEFRMYKVVVISQKGNVYFSHNYSSTINPTYIHLDKLEKVVEIAPAHYWWSQSAYSYVLNEDGELFYIYGSLEQNPTPVKIEGLPRIHYDNKFLLSSTENLVVVRGEDEKFYCIYRGDIVYTWDFEDINIVDYCYYPTWFCAVDDTGTLHGYNLTREIEGDTNESHLVVTEANWSGQTRDIGPKTVSDPVPYIRIKEDYQTIDYTSSKYTNLEYKIRFALHQNISNDGLRNVVNYVTEYSTDNGVTWTAYNHSECQGSRTYTLADVENAAEELTEIAEVASDRIKTYLDTLIGDITLPGTNGNGELTKEISGLKSGKKFYLKTTFTKGATTNTDCVINYQTVYGTTLNYGTIYNQGTVTVTATGKEFSALTWSSDGKTIANNGPVNYKNHTSILTALAQDSAKGFFKKVQDLAAVQMFNVALPGSVSGAETAATKYTTAAGAGGGDGGNVYYYQVKYSQDDTTDTTNKIKIQVFYGNATNTVTTNTFYSDTYTILSTNYTTAIADIQNIAKGKVTDLKNFLNIPDVAGSLPATIERTYTKNNFAFKITIERAAKSASEKNIIITTPKVDGLIYGSAVTQTFHGTISSALTILETKANEFITAIENMCSAAPANTSSVYDKGNCHFTVGTSYSKTANNTNITVNTMCDGVVHKTSTVTIKTNANTIGTALTGSGGATPTATTDLNALKTVLSKCPVDTDVAYSKGNMNFTITKQFAKTAGNTTATYKVLVDGIEYQAATNVTLRPAVANLATDLATLGSNAGTYVTNAQTVLNGCPTDSSEDKTKNGFAYTLGIGYTKSAGTPKATSFATLDGTKYGSNTYDFKITTFAANKDTLVNNATTGKTTLANIINESPANTSETKTYNGFKYNVKTQYSKTKGQNVVTIKTLFDDQTYKSETKTVDPSSFVNDLNAITLQASNRKTELLNILDDSPANTDTTIYTIDGFKYYVGATFTKAADNKQVTVKIKLDGADKETYTANINGSTTASDIAAIASNANTKVTNLKNSLRGLPMVSVPWTVNGFNFNLKVKYVKDLDSGKITISSYIDDTKHLSDEVYDFVVDNIDTYSSKGDAKITALKNVVNNSPANTEKNVSKNNLSFKVGINYEKAKDSPTVYVYSMLDGNKLAGPHTINYDPNNIAAISTKGATDLTLLENTLNACPANYTTNYNVGNMGFTIGSAFSKTAGNSTVTIQTTLDGDNYGSAATQTFNINDIGALATKAQEKELALKAILDTCPKDSLEKFVYKKFAFNIEKLYSKTAGYHVVTSMVKLDGVQYDQYHQENFNVSNIGSIANSNNTIVENLKSRLVSVIPDDVHTTYSRNNFNFTIDAYYSKKEGSDVVDIEYNIDSADLSNDSDPISFSASSDMSHVNNG